MQKVGYVPWHGEDQNDPQDNKITLYEASVILKVLVVWSHSVKSSKSLTGTEPLKPDTIT